MSSSIWSWRFSSLLFSNTVSHSNYWEGIKSNWSLLFSIFPWLSLTNDEWVACISGYSSVVLKLQLYRLFTWEVASHVFKWFMKCSISIVHLHYLQTKAEDASIILNITLVRQSSASPRDSVVRSFVRSFSILWSLSSMWLKYWSFFFCFASSSLFFDRIFFLYSLIFLSNSCSFFLMMPLNHFSDCWTWTSLFRRVIFCFFYAFNSSELTRFILSAIVFNTCWLACFISLSFLVSLNSTTYFYSWQIWSSSLSQRVVLPSRFSHTKLCLCSSSSILPLIYLKHYLSFSWRSCVRWSSLSVNSRSYLSLWSSNSSLSLESSIP